MTILVADVGGTNARLALVADDELLASTVSKYSNKKYGSFYEIVAEYLTRHNVTDISACCVAMAGPVFAGRGELTNLDWEISTDELKAVTQCSAAQVMNDLTALGYAVGRLRSDNITPILAQSAGRDQNGQSLVVGIGTGFNVCPVKILPTGATICLEAEAGHTGLSPAVKKLMQAEIGAQSEGFETAEDLFSGRGLARWHQVRSKSEAALSGGQIVRAHVDATDALASVSLMAYCRMLGAHCRELMLQYMPLDGVYFAGSVARGVLGSGLVSEFVAELMLHPRFRPLLGQIPVSIINEDAAALLGCVVASRAA